MFATSQFTSSVPSGLNALHPPYVTVPFDKPFGPILPVKVLLLQVMTSVAPSSLVFSVERPPVPLTPNSSVTGTNSNFPLGLFSGEQLLVAYLVPAPSFSKQSKYTGVMAEADADANAPTRAMATTPSRSNLIRDMVRLSPFCTGDRRAAMVLPQRRSRSASDAPVFYLCLQRGSYRLFQGPLKAAFHHARPPARRQAQFLARTPEALAMPTISSIDACFRASTEARSRKQSGATWPRRRPTHPSRHNRGSRSNLETLRSTASVPGREPRPEEETPCQPTSCSQT